MITEIRGITKWNKTTGFLISVTETLTTLFVQRQNTLQAEILSIIVTVTDSYLFDGSWVVSEGLSLRQLCILSFQRHQFLSLLQTTGWDSQVNKIEYFTISAYNECSYLLKHYKQIVLLSLEILSFLLRL